MSALGYDVHFTHDIKPTVVFYVLWLVVIPWHCLWNRLLPTATTTVQYLRLMKNVSASVLTVLKHATSLRAPRL